MIEIEMHELDWKVVAGGSPWLSWLLRFRAPVSLPSRWLPLACRPRSAACHFWSLTDCVQNVTRKVSRGRAFFGGFATANGHEWTRMGETGGGAESVIGVHWRRFAVFSPLFHIPYSIFQPASDRRCRGRLLDGRASNKLNAIPPDHALHLHSRTLRRPARSHVRGGTGLAERASAVQWMGDYAGREERADQ